MPTNLSSRAGRSERIYWSARQWMYEIPKPLVVVGGTRSPGVYAVDQSGRPLTADDRNLVQGDSVANAKVRELLAQWPLARMRHSMRPIIAKLLARMWSANGDPVMLNEVCRHLWGRNAAPTYSTFHTTIYKANAALRAANCPLRLKSRLNQVIFFLS